MQMATGQTGLVPSPKGLVEVPRDAQKDVEPPVEVP